MFGRVILNGMFGDERLVDDEFALLLGRRLARRNEDDVNRQRVMQWMGAGHWDELREWLLADHEGEAPLPGAWRKQ